MRRATAPRRSGRPRHRRAAATADATPPTPPQLATPPQRPPATPVDLPSLVSVARAAVARERDAAAPPPLARPPGTAWRASARGGGDAKFHIAVNRALVRAAAAVGGGGECAASSTSSPPPTASDADAFAGHALDLLTAGPPPKGRPGDGSDAATVALPAAPPRPARHASPSLAPPPRPSRPLAASPVNVGTALHRLGVVWRATGAATPPRRGSAAARLLDAAATAGGVARLHRWPPRSIANAAWGVASTLRPPRFLAAGGGDRVPRPAGDSESDGDEPPALRAPLPPPAIALVEAAMHALGAAPPSAFKPQEVATVAWAAGTLCVGDAAAWRSLAAAAEASLAASGDAYTPQGVSMVTWALGRARYRHVGALDAAGAHAAARVASYSPQALANLTWALAVLRHPPPPGLLHDAVGVIVDGCWGVESVGGGGKACPPLSSFDVRATTQAVGNFCWAAAALGGLDAPSLTALVMPLAPHLATPTAPREALHQVWQAARLVETADSGSGDTSCSSLPALPPPLAAAASAARRAAARPAAAAATGLANAVFRAFAASPRTHTADAEATIAAGHHRVDAALVTHAGARVAVEADGPPHYLTSHPRFADGATAVRDALLRRDGWAVVAVPYWEWDEMGGDAVAEAAYVERRLAAVDRDVRGAEDALRTRWSRWRGGAGLATPSEEVRERGNKWG